MAYNVCCVSYRAHYVTVVIILVKYVTCAISRGRCLLIGLLVVISVVAVLVLLLFSFPVDAFII